MVEVNHSSAVAHSKFVQEAIAELLGAGCVHCKNYLVRMTTCAWLLVSGFIEQVGNMIKRIPKHNYHPPTPSQSIKLQRHMSASQYIPVLNWIYNNQLASRQVSVLAL